MHRGRTDRGIGCVDLAVGRIGMDILIVDDFPAIVDSLKNGIDWKRLGITEVHTATSAKAAKMILLNFRVDIMICDIEMPEENGLELVRWAREHVKRLEIIFLTSHAEFDYLMEAMHLGSYDYILQPVRFEDVIRAVEKLIGKIREDDRHRKLEQITRKEEDQHNYILEKLLEEDRKGNVLEAKRIEGDYLGLYQYIFEEGVSFHSMLEVIRWNRLILRKDKAQTVPAVKRMVEEIAGTVRCRVCVTACGEDRYWILLFMEKKDAQESGCKEMMERLHETVGAEMDCGAALYYVDEYTQGMLIDSYHCLEQLCEDNAQHRAGIYSFSAKQVGAPGRHPAIDDALRYLEKHMNENVSRSEIAGEIGMSEEYFSRLFKQETGSTFKEYVLDIKMKKAMELLKTTDLSIGIIASKVGYSNFSYFSQQFRTFTGLTPQEYKKKER